MTAGAPTVRRFFLEGPLAPVFAVTLIFGASPALGAIAVAAVANASNGSGYGAPAVSSLSYSLSVPAGTDRVLIVSVGLANSPPCAAVPTVSGITYVGLALSQITTIVGTPICPDETTRSDQWWLVAPAAGTHDVIVTLSGNVQSIHSGALALTGVDQTLPVRNFAAASGRAASSTVTVASATGDLVVNTVGQGYGVASVGGGQTQQFLNNVDTGNPLNNSAAATAPGAAGTVTTTWTFGGPDEWQTISTSLVPSGTLPPLRLVWTTGTFSVDSGASAQSVEFARNPSVGDRMLVLAWGWDQAGATIPALAASDTAGNTYAVDAEVVQPTDHASAAILSAPITATGANFKVTVTSAAPTANIEAVALEYSGLGMPDRTGTNSGSSGSPTVSTSGATTTPDELVASAINIVQPASTNFQSIVPTTGFTSRASEWNSSSTEQAGDGSDRIVTTTGVKSNTWTTDPATFLWIAAIATYVVTPPPVATKLAFSVQPTSAGAGSAISPAVQVAVQDAIGTTVSISTASVTLAIGTNPGGGALGGAATTNAIAGIATFSNLSIDEAGAGYTLVASSGALTGATSAAFDISPGAAPDAGPSSDAGGDAGGGPFDGGGGGDAGGADGGGVVDGGGDGGGGALDGGDTRGDGGSDPVGRRRRASGRRTGRRQTIGARLVVWLLGGRDSGGACCAWYRLGPSPAPAAYPLLERRGLDGEAVASPASHDPGLTLAQNALTAAPTAAPRQMLPALENAASGATAASPVSGQARGPKAPKIAKHTAAGTSDAASARTPDMSGGRRACAASDTARDSTPRCTTQSAWPRVRLKLGRPCHAAKAAPASTKIPRPSPTARSFRRPRAPTPPSAPMNASPRIPRRGERASGTRGGTDTAATGPSTMGSMAGAQRVGEGTPNTVAAVAATEVIGWRANSPAGAFAL